ncbi:ABC transporter permease [Candidatus Woesearchaeota archaeon]|nr:ABC transporter permease [Candidatus Woesearchaeota archaeon]
MKWYRIKALLLKYWYLTKNRLDRLFDVIYWPLIDVFIWGFAIYFIESISEVSVLSMIMGGIILWVFIWRACQDLVVYVLEDFWSRNVYNLFTSPITSMELVASLMIFSLLRAAATFLIMWILTAVVYAFDITTLGLLPFVVSIPVLVLFGWVLGIFITALIFIFGKSIQVFAWSIVWVIQPFSCVFYPLAALPEWAQSIAILFPTTHVFENLRQSITTGTMNWPSIGYAYVVSVILLVLVSLFFQYALERAKKTGLLCRYE